MIPALGRWSQVDLCEFKSSLVYKGSLSLKNKQTKAHITVPNKNYRNALCM